MVITRKELCCGDCMQFLPDVLNYENYTTVRSEIELVPEYTLDFLQVRRHNLSVKTSGAVSQLIVHDLSKPATNTRK